MSIRYRHTQIGTLILAFAIPALLVAGWFAVRKSPGGLMVLLVAIFIVVSLASLTTTVSDEDLTVSFGIGLIRRRIPLKKIASASVVRNPWYYGWGIRITPNGWLWNVSGLGAVELSYVDGGRFRIGSDEPERLAAAIQGSRNK